MRLYSVLLFLLIAFGPAQAQTPPAPPATNAPTPPRALPVTQAELDAAASASTAQAPLAVAGGVNVRWFGHGFVYLTSSVGIRAAIDPFGPTLVHYKFPDHLSADIVLVTHESDDHCAADQIFGNPLIFRSVMAVGLQRANGIPFYGVSLQKDPNGNSGANTAFKITFDGVTFAYLGQISMPLAPQEKIQFGKIDVLFLPVGLTTLSPTELNKVVTDLGARIIIPVNYKTDESGDLQLRSLEEYLDETKFPLRKFNSDEIVITRSSIPDTPTLYVLKSP